MVDSFDDTSEPGPLVLQVVTLPSSNWDEPRELLPGGLGTFHDLAAGRRVQETSYIKIRKYIHVLFMTFSAARLKTSLYARHPSPTLTCFSRFQHRQIPCEFSLHIHPNVTATDFGSLSQICVMKHPFSHGNLWDDT